MSGHIVYRAIIGAVRNGKLKEPFTVSDLIAACPDLYVKTCNTFLHNHRLGNPSYHSELFIQVTERRFRLIRPLKYGIEQLEANS